MQETRTCPICKRQIGEGEDTLRFRPFCSKRCGDIDLGRWLKGAYAVPATEVDDEDGDAGEGESHDSDEAPPVRH
jgi:endogenous inhibitor of DNA gyrase (YacG/DUF329 family)